MADNLSAGTQYHVMVDSDAYTVMSEFTPTSSNATSYQSEAALEDEFIRILTSQGYDYLGGGAENGRSLRSRPRLLALRVSSPPQVPEGTCGPPSSILRTSDLRHKKRAPLLGVHGHLWWRCGEWAVASLAPTAPRASRLVAAAGARGHLRPSEFDSPLTDLGA